MEKKFEFSQVLGKNVTGNKVLDSWDFFSENSMGAANKVSGNKISGKKENKSEKKKNLCIFTC